MSSLTLRKSRVRAHRFPWVLRGSDGRVIDRFLTFTDALRFLRAMNSAAQY